MRKIHLILLLLVATWGPMQARSIYVMPGEKIGDALIEARRIYQEDGSGTTIVIMPGDYEEELTIDVPGIRLINARCQTPNTNCTEVLDAGTKIGKDAVRISWYYGHGYQYRSMGDKFNWGGRRYRRWNASVLVTAPDFYAEGIIFQNSFNIYVSPAEAADSLSDVADNPQWTQSERPRRMPVRPKQVYSTEVQQRLYGERAAAISFTEGAKHAELRNCRVVGRQDALYGDHGADVWIDNCILQGGVDYIFGGMDLTILNSQLVAQVSNEKGDRCYITAGRGAVREDVENDSYYHPEHRAMNDSIPADEYVKQGFYIKNCRVRYATHDEIALPVNPLDSVQTKAHPIYLARPWRWWGKHVFRGIKADAGVLVADPEKDFDKTIHHGLTKGHITPYCTYKK